MSESGKKYIDIIDDAAEAYATGNHRVSFSDTHEKNAFKAGVAWRDLNPKKLETDKAPFEQAYKDMPGISRGAINSLIFRGMKYGRVETSEDSKRLEWMIETGMIMCRFHGLFYLRDEAGNTVDPKNYLTFREAIDAAMENKK